MKKYLAYYETEWPANIAELTAVENWPFVGYLEGGEVLYTVIPEVLPNNEIWYTSTDGNIVTPNNTDAFGANIIDNSYKNGKGVITFDRDVTNIGLDAFFACHSLTSVTIPNSVTSIGDLAFGGCKSLTSVAIPSSVTNISSEAFASCSSLNSITYEGTQEQWNAISKEEAWIYDVLATYVQCSDGQVQL